MAKKTWKLGEVCRGGIITVETKNNLIKVIGKEWDYSQGTNKGSNQSNAKEWTRLEVDAEVSDADRQLSMFINDLTTSYHTDNIMKWIESKTKLNKRMFW
jgi:hypothetical protein